MPDQSDLAPLWTPDPAGLAAPMSYLQGTITAWNPVTLQNTVSVGGATLTDLPVLGVAEAATFVPGVVVGLIVAGGTIAILGRLVPPNTADATDAITKLAQQVYTASIATLESTTSTTPTDLATVGPSVTVPIGASGKALLILSSFISPSVGNEGAHMSYASTGANTFSPSGTQKFFGFNANASWSIAAARVVTLTGLNSGSTTFTAKYQTFLGNAVAFAERSITVIAL
jgi:hypothetical protein